MMDQDNHPNQNENSDVTSDAPQAKADGQEPVKKHRKPVVLKFKKRFYDGEQEGELIKRLERQYREMQFDENTAATPPVSEAALPMTSPSSRPSLRVVNPQAIKQAATPVAAPPTAEAKKYSNRQQAMQALFLGPLEICVSVLGVITAGFALITFACFKNQELNQHSKVVLHECRRAFMRGIKNTIIGPGKALHHLRQAE